MEKQQAVQEIIKLKKQYGSGGNDAQITQQAETIRQQYGLDNNKYGSGVSIADAYTNYNNEYGQTQSRGQQPPQNQSGGFNQEQAMSDIQRMLQNNSNSYLDEQTSNFDRQLSQQIAQLESTYAEAVAQGQMGVREAEQAFAQQKSEVEKMAYQQAEATKLHATEMGLGNSQQMVGMMQGDNARENTMHNSNMSERDKRIADIKDRMNALNTQKSLALTNAKNEYGYNVAGAQAQASQMYNKSMADLMGQNYSANLNQSFTEKNMATQQNYNKENMGLEQGYRKELAEFTNNLDISKMWVGHEINLKEFDKQLENQFKIMDKNFGIDKAMAGINSSNAMKQISEQARIQAQMAQDEYKTAMDREARRLGIKGEYDEATINEYLIKEGNTALINEMNMKREAGIRDAIAMGTVQREMEILNNPSQYINPINPNKKDYRGDTLIGKVNPVNNFLNLVTGYGGKDVKTYEEEMKFKTEAENQANAIKKKYKDLYGIELK